MRMNANSNADNHEGHEEHEEQARPLMQASHGSRANSGLQAKTALLFFSFVPFVSFVVQAFQDFSAPSCGKNSLAAHQRQHQRLLHMQPVLGLVDRNTIIGIHHLVGGLDVAP